jgi:hypothetical protein
MDLSVDQANPLLDSYEHDKNIKDEKLRMDRLDQANQLLGLYERIKNAKDDFTVAILGNLLKYAPPNSHGRDNVCEDIIKCAKDTGLVDSIELRQLAEWYRKGLLIPSE